MSPRPSTQMNGEHKSAERASIYENLYFLSSNAAHALPNFQYSGQDNSLLYHYVLSPLATFCVNRLTPKTVAPNTITLIALCLMVVSYSVFWYHAPNLEVDLSAPPPSWIFLLNGIFMLIYQTLDNMDGKQARRTGSSSPLGLLFDHGCDAVNSMFGSANWIIAMGMHPIDDFWSCAILLMGPMLMFYVATWEEYHTGTLVLPIVNGPSDGLFGGAMLSITTAICGIDFWQSQSWFEKIVQPYIMPLLPQTLQSLVPVTLRNADLVVIASSIGFVQEIVLKSAFVSRTYGVKSLWSLFPFFSMTASWCVLAMQDQAIWTQIPRTNLHLCSALFVEISTQLMLDHITCETYQSFRWPLVPLVLLAVVMVIGDYEASRFTDDYLLAYATALSTYVLMKMGFVIHEICFVLSIWCFDIVTPRQRVSLLSDDEANDDFSKVSESSSVLRKRR